MGRMKNIYRIILLVLPLLCVAVVAGCALLYADDYYYGTFLQKGWSGFVTSNIDHYTGFNGRVLVHLLVQILIPLQSVGFCIFTVAMLWILGRSGARLSQGAGNYVCCLFFGLCLLIPLPVLRESLFWRSASCNYLFPTALLTVSVLHLQKRKACGLKWYDAALFFLCGATTEQSGLATVFMLFVALITFRKGRRGNLFFKGILPSSLGVLTILASPATRMRVGVENEVAGTGFLGELLARLASVSETLLSWQGCGLFCILFALALLFTCKAKAFKIISGLWSAGLCMYMLLPKPAEVAAIMVILQLLYGIAATCLMLKHRQAYGFFTAFAYSTVLVMVATRSVTPRTMLPFLLITALVTAELMSSISRKTLLQSVVVLLGVAHFIPIMAGYAYNASIDRGNRSRMTEMPYRYQLDYDDRYRHTLMHDDGFFNNMFCAYYGLQGKEIQFFSRKTPSILVEGKEIAYPVTESEGRQWIPVSLVLEAMGAEKSYDGMIASFVLDGKTFAFNFATKRLEYDLAGKAVSIDFSDKMQLGVNLCLELKSTCEAFGWTYEERDHILYISR